MTTKKLLFNSKKLIAIYTISDPEQLHTFDDGYEYDLLKKYDSATKNYTVYLFAKEYFSKFICNKTTLSIDYLAITDKVTDMSGMFNKCTELYYINTHGWNTSSVTDMSRMFYNCSSLTQLDLSDFNTSSVTDMSCMFLGCGLLPSIIGINDLIVNNVNSIAGMFLSCRNLKELIIDKWKTDNITNMSDLFRDCANLTSLDSISEWNTSSVTDMSGMFRECASLTSLNLSKWDVSNVANMEEMFYMDWHYSFIDTELSSLNIDGWNVSNVTDMSNMFHGCSKLKYINVENWETDSLENITGMFTGCNLLQSLNLSNWKTDNLRYIDQLFYHCKSLTTLNLDNWNISKVTSIFGTFAYCSSIKELDLSSWTADVIERMNSAFYNCSSLLKLKLFSFIIEGHNDDFSSFDNFEDVFSGCSINELIMNDITTSDKQRCIEFLLHLFSSLSSCENAEFSNWKIKESPAYYNQDFVLTGLFCEIGVKNLVLDNWSFEKTDGSIADIYIKNLFLNNTEVNSVIISNWKCHEVEIDRMFEGCSSLKSASVIADGDTTPMITYYTYSLFKNCTSLNTVNVSGIRSYSRGISEVFTNCISLNYADISSFYFSGYQDRELFTDCINLNRVVSEKAGSFVESLPQRTEESPGVIITKSDIDPVRSEILASKYWLVNEEVFIPLEKITIDGPDYIESCFEVTLSYSVTPANTHEQYAVWESSDENIATVDNGVVTRVGFGPVEITCIGANDPDKKDTVTINFVEPENILDVVIGLEEETRLSYLPVVTYNPDSSSVQTSLRYVGIVNGLHTYGNIIPNADETIKIEFGIHYDNGSVAQPLGNETNYVFLSNTLLSGINNMKKLFYGFHKLNLDNVKNIENWDVSSVTDMSSMFSSCHKLTSIDKISGWDVSSVTDMSRMFYNCSLTSIDKISGWDVSSVTNMSCMFDGCSSLTSVNLPNLNVNNVTDMSRMFRWCSGLNSINLSNLNSPKLANTSNMFESCSALVNLNLRGLNAISLSTVDDMFINAGVYPVPAIDELDLTHWKVSENTNIKSIIDQIKFDLHFDLLKDFVYDFSYWEVNSKSVITTVFKELKHKNLNLKTNGWILNNITDLSNVFLDIYNSPNTSDDKELNLTDWDVSCVKNMSYMFHDCTNIKAIHGLSTWNTNNVTDMSYMFSGCFNLTELDLSGWTSDNVTDMSCMFQYCSALTAIGNISKWNTGSVTNMRDMFSGCRKLAELDLSGWTTDNVTKIEFMFYGCYKLSTLIIPNNWNLSKATDLCYMFYNCRELLELNINDWNVENVTKMAAMFYRCESLKNLDLSKWKIKFASHSYEIFFMCTSLESLDISNFDVSNHESDDFMTGTYKNMLNGCSSLQSVRCSEVDITKVIKAAYDNSTVQPGGKIYFEGSQISKPSESNISLLKEIGWEVVHSITLPILDSDPERLLWIEASSNGNLHVTEIEGKKVYNLHTDYNQKYFLIGIKSTDVKRISATYDSQMSYDDTRYNYSKVNISYSTFDYGNVQLLNENNKVSELILNTQRDTCYINCEVYCDGDGTSDLYIKKIELIYG